MMRILLLIGYLLIAGFLSFLLGLQLHHAAHAHLADRPDLNQWAKGLKNDLGMPCCDGSDAEPIMDPDWRASPDGHYQLRIADDWVDVPPSAIVPGPNKYGRALVWGYWEIGETRKFTVRCFMPGGGA